ncbi:MAG: Hsp20/alpha crystallin family protein [Neisseriales bacterium]|nr:MAG: Hsp20/alpha crystallin family protein [Neisseriales bacterium]
MTRVMHSPLEDFFKGFFIRPVEFGTDPFNQFAAPTVLLDVKEATDSYIVRAELPGIKKHDIKVDINGKHLVITAEKKQEKSAEKEEKILHSECFYGRVTRSLELSQEIDDTQSSASFVDGVLELRLHKKLAQKGHQLAIQ